MADFTPLYLRAMLMLALIVIAINLGGYLKRRKFHYLGESAVYMLLGLFMGLVYMNIGDGTDEHSKKIQLSSRFFYMVLLPPIIFEGGFSLQRMTFFKNIVTILSLAFIGALYSTVVTSIIIWFVSKFVNPLSMVESLVFGALISSTDPVTVLGCLPANIDRKLYMLIFGESALNDAVAIILYRFFTSLADPTMRLGAGPFLLSIAESIMVFVGSCLVGAATAFVFALMTKYVKMPEAFVYESMMLLIFAYSSYLIAEVVDLTGIIAVFMCGVCMAHYAYNNLQDMTVTSMKVILRVLSTMCEAFIFLYLGLGMVAFGRDKTRYDAIFIVGALVAIFVSRTHVFFICSASNLVNHNERIPFKQQILIWFSGLRGAVAFALSVTFLEIPNFSDDSKSLIFGTTVMIVFLTILILGGLTPFMLRWLKINDDVVGGADHHHNPEGGTYDQVQLEGEEEESLREEDMRPAFAWLYRVDKNYIRPFFSKPDTKTSHNPHPATFREAPVMQQPPAGRNVFGSKDELNGGVLFEAADKIGVLEGECANGDADVRMEGV